MMDVFPFKLMIYSCACPVTQQFRIWPQEALMCFQVNNFPRSLRSDLFISVPLRQGQGRHCVKRRQSPITFVLPLLNESLLICKQVWLSGSKMFLSHYRCAESFIVRLLFMVFLNFHARCQDLKKWFWQPWRWPMVQLFWEETGQELKQR